MRTSIYRFGQLFNIIDGDRGNNYPGDNDIHDEGYCFLIKAGSKLGLYERVEVK